uniref:Uncharacterized protein n=1 Tax=Chromera velia CCMP2878 TaxID=1169474 RepID=A0A0G4GTP4_9ALVE|eukprot:Cvel_23347.t1-p1 / transcript=Cvel_23347.t1 / gene=Cvel_23347 / organism=Chromera_velia_CCMP2878 / gene_product=hypothetical protein / transcript_product=hypothetical protein / location=Cvel_scaffold2394:11334-14757(-) / protein_length=364 / sequence_SO=supercontig / SO=protein_coding / is_pseudo=false
MTKRKTPPRPQAPDDVRARGDAADVRAHEAGAASHFWSAGPESDGGPHALQPGHVWAPRGADTRALGPYKEPASLQAIHNPVRTWVNTNTMQTGLLPGGLDPSDRVSKDTPSNDGFYLMPPATAAGHVEHFSGRQPGGLRIPLPSNRTVSAPSSHHEYIRSPAAGHVCSPQPSASQSTSVPASGGGSSGSASLSVRTGSATAFMNYHHGRHQADQHNSHQHAGDSSVPSYGFPFRSPAGAVGRLGGAERERRVEGLGREDQSPAVCPPSPLPFRASLRRSMRSSRLPLGIPSPLPEKKEWARMSREWNGREAQPSLGASGRLSARFLMLPETQTHGNGFGGGEGLFGISAFDPTDPLPHFPGNA